MAGTLDDYTTTPFYSATDGSLLYAKGVSNSLPNTYYDSIKYWLNTNKEVTTFFTYNKGLAITDTSSAIREYLGYNNNGNCVSHKNYQKSGATYNLWDNDLYVYETNVTNQMLSSDEAALTGLYELCSKSSLKKIDLNGLVTFHSTKIFINTFNRQGLPSNASVTTTGAVFVFLMEALIFTTNNTIKYCKLVLLPLIASIE
jgi:hypothetical protein